MTEYCVKIGFWLRAYDGFTIEAASDEEAVMKAKSAALEAMQSHREPEHVAYEDRREGIIVLIDRIDVTERTFIGEDIPFDTDRIHGKFLFPNPPSLSSPADAGFFVF